MSLVAALVDHELPVAVGGRRRAEVAEVDGERGQTGLSSDIVRILTFVLHRSDRPTLRSATG